MDKTYNNLKYLLQKSTKSSLSRRPVWTPALLSNYFAYDRTNYFFCILNVYSFIEIHTDDRLTTNYETTKTEIQKSMFILFQTKFKTEKPIK